MSEAAGVRNTDTVSSMAGEEISFLPQGKSGGRFDYTYLCKSVLKEKKGKVNAGFLVPLKMYHEKKEMCQENILAGLEEWMDAFLRKSEKKKGDISHFWIYMAYDGGDRDMMGQTAGTAPEKYIPDKAQESAQTHMNDVSKLWKTRYIAQLCENRDDVECWILQIYQINLSKMYSVSEMAIKMKDVVAYLKKCGLQVNEPFTTGSGQTDEQIFQAAANLFLLLVRLEVNIAPKKAVDWYKSGNVAFFRYRDSMLEDYMRLESTYFRQSYERFLKMREMAERGKNKYAAKEVGDILRLGMEFQDSRGNRISVKPDGEAACEFYRICIDNNYIPAYIPAIKTGALINGQQRENLLREALAEKAPEALAYHVRMLLDEADKWLRTEEEKAFRALREAADALILLEDTYGEKQILKAGLLQTEAFDAYNRHKDPDQGFDDALRELYNREMINIGVDVVLEEVEKAYLKAGSLGYHEAEYRLGKLFLQKDEKKSREYFGQGTDKGCKWCRLEYVKTCRQQDPKNWLTHMMELGRHMQENSELLIEFAECWAEAEDVLTDLADGKIELGDDEIAEIYLQMNHVIEKIYGQKRENSSKRDSAIALCGKLIQCKEKVMKLLKEGNA